MKLVLVRDRRRWDGCNSRAYFHRNNYPE